VVIQGVLLSVIYYFHEGVIYDKALKFFKARLRSDEKNLKRGITHTFIRAILNLGQDL